MESLTSTGGPPMPARIPFASVVRFLRLVAFVLTLAAQVITAIVG